MLLAWGRGCRACAERGFGSTVVPATLPVIATKHWVGKSVAGVIVGAAAIGGAVAGTGEASAKIESGFYELSTVVTGGPSFTPTSAVPSNARVIGNRLYYDEGGVGPWNTNQYVIKPTRKGGTVTPGGIGDVVYRAELHKTRTGYKGPSTSSGFPTASWCCVKWTGTNRTPSGRPANRGSPGSRTPRRPRTTWTYPMPRTRPSARRPRMLRMGRIPGASRNSLSRGAAMNHSGSFPQRHHEGTGSGR